MKNEMSRIGDILERIASSLEKDGTMPATATPTLRWTGESINLVELAYGVWLTGQLDHGNATVSDIIRLMEQTLGVNIGRAYRRWTEISRRDRMHTTKFLDRMRREILERIQNEEELKRQQRRKERD